MEWDSNKQWRKQVERRVYELASLVKGNMPAQADRISDLADQIDELRKELKPGSDSLEMARKAFAELRTEVKENGK